MIRDVVIFVVAGGLILGGGTGRQLFCDFIIVHAGYVGLSVGRRLHHHQASDKPQLSWCVCVCVCVCVCARYLGTVCSCCHRL